MNIPRLKRMIEVLLEVEAKHAGHFDMKEWAIGTDCHNDRPAMMQAEQHTCGSSACAVGWYAIKNKDEGIPWQLGWESVAGHFGITEQEAFHLFDTDDNTENPRHVINRIREMIGEGV